MAAEQGPFYIEFGRKLAAARRSAHITQEALGKAVNLSRTSIVNIEKGRQPVNLQLAVRMATSLNTTLSRLLPDTPLQKVVDDVPDLQKVSEQNRPWVQRVIAGSAFLTETNNAAEVFTRQTQSKGIARRSRRR